MKTPLRDNCETVCLVLDQSHTESFAPTKAHIYQDIQVVNSNLTQHCSTPLSHGRLRAKLLT